MSEERFSKWERDIVRTVVFVMFLVAMGKVLWIELEPILSPVVAWVTTQLGS